MLPDTTGLRMNRRGSNIMYKDETVIDPKRKSLAEISKCKDNKILPIVQKISEAKVCAVIMRRKVDKGSTGKQSESAEHSPRHFPNGGGRRSSVIYKDESNRLRSSLRY